MVDAGAYVSALINTPWDRVTRHCWRLVCDVQRDLFGRAVPAYLDAAPPGRAGRELKAKRLSESARYGWCRAAVPAHGAVALMRLKVAPPGFYIHAGVYLAIDTGGVLHSDDPHGVVFDNLLELKARGWVADYFVPKETDT